MQRSETYSCKRTSTNAYYSLLRHYEILPLDKKIAPYFIYTHGDFGTQGPLNKNGMQEYDLSSEN